MRNELQIVWRGLDASKALTERIERQVARLGDFETCRLTVEVPRRNHFEVKVELTVPGSVFAVTRSPKGRGNADPHSAVNEAFATLRRRLEARAPERRARARHARLPVGSWA